MSRIHDLIDRHSRRPCSAAAPIDERAALAIRRARDEDTPMLHDLAVIDSAAPLQGEVLVAIVDGRIWAALALEDDRVIADPFLPTAAAVELLTLRVRQLRAAGDRQPRRSLARRVPGRARA
ncbi:MAG TPA: hypothetical protein VHZ75_00600 [Solirubrobacteraceae bacterium]|nr:hypothetical protein [Solirubrobacteraceae bacterium]